jgi:hypothetical protein
MPQQRIVYPCGFNSTVHRAERLTFHSAADPGHLCWPVALKAGWVGVNPVADKTLRPLHMFQFIHILVELF